MACQRPSVVKSLFYEPKYVSFATRGSVSLDFIDGIPNFFCMRILKEKESKVPKKV